MDQPIKSRTLGLFYVADIEWALRIDRANRAAQAVLDGRFEATPLMAERLRGQSER